MFACEKHGHGLGFALEPRQSVSVLRELGREHLDRHMAIEASVLGLVDFAHAPGPEGGDDLVGAETGAGSEDQVRWIICAD